MAAIYIQYYEGAGAVKNLDDGANVAAELELARKENPGKECWVIGRQSFGAEPCGGPECDMMPGY